MPPVISLRGFAGETPKVQPYYLPETHAVESIGARLDRGDLTPFNAMVAERSFPSAQDTIYIHGAEWLSWDGDADAVPGFPHAAFKHVTDAKLAPHLPNVGRLALVGEGRVARDNEQPPQS